MQPLTLIALVSGTVFAAAGQLFLKMGASGREHLADFINAWIISGIAAYGLGTLLWIYSLARVRLSVVYPFTALTFVIVYLVAVFILHEPTSPSALLGVLLVLAGLFLIVNA
jgi:drug/metabolite transporter (DMT)-like permease